MKYMTFNSSCSYAALANLLEPFGVDTTDRQIALDMGLPYFFAKEGGAYLAGPMLQGKRWFDLYLNPIGLAMTETAVPRKDLCAYLQTAAPAMLGLHVSENSKHAVIFTGIENEQYSFLNSKWAHSNEPETLRLTQEELLSRVDDTATVGTLTRTSPTTPDLSQLYQSSVSTLRSMEEEIIAFCAFERTPRQLRQVMDPFFRPLLVDAVTMADLLGESTIRDRLKILQSQFMTAIRADRPVRLAEVLDLPLLAQTVGAYIQLIRSKENP